jgi:hypothetical protein
MISQKNEKSKCNRYSQNFNFQKTVKPLKGATFWDESFVFTFKYLSSLACTHVHQKIELSRVCVECHSTVPQRGGLAQLGTTHKEAQLLAIHMRERDDRLDSNVLWKGETEDLKERELKRWAKKEKKKDSLWFKCKKHFSSVLHRLMSLYFFIVFTKPNQNCMYHDSIHAWAIICCTTWNYCSWNINDVLLLFQSNDYVNNALFSLIHCSCHIM